MLSSFALPIPLIDVHLWTLALLIPLIAFADHLGFDWLTGKKEMLKAKVVGTVHILTGIGLTIMIVTGAFLAWPVRDYLATNLAFWVKMAFVVTLVVNSFFIGRLMEVATTKSFKSLTAKERFPFFVSGGLSGIGWAGAVIAATLMGFGNIQALFQQFF